MTRSRPQAPATTALTFRDAVTLLVCALLVTLPLWRGGPSCGHDFDFHIQSWLDAAAQLRHGNYPHWDRTAAWNAGEPRFLFYPPLSWLLGAALTLLLPVTLAPAALTILALAGAGLAMRRLAAEFAPPPAALAAAALYLANPYTLFTAFERTAFAELLAAVWLPLLLLGLLRARPTVRGIAVPLALLWLTNAPAAVIGTYALALVTALRLLQLWRKPTAAGAPAPATPTATPARFAIIATAGALLGLALPAFYLLPAALDRPAVSISMAIIPNMRPTDNFLFGGTGDAPHDAVLHTASLLGVALLATTALLLLLTLTRRRRPHPTPRLPPFPTLLFPLTTLLAAIAFLLTPASGPLWKHLPELAFLQFPWRLLSLLAVILALAFALVLQRTLTRTAATLLALALAASLGTFAIHHFRQGCAATDTPAAVARLFATHHGFAPTDEYTPAAADNDVLRSDDPAWWLAATDDSPAPGTVPNPAAAAPDADLTPPLDETVSALAPRTLTLDLARPAILVLNLRDFPAWRLTRNGAPALPHLQRDDGLLAVRLPAGHSVLAVRWIAGPAEIAGSALSLFAALLLAFLTIRSRQSSRPLV